MATVTLPVYAAANLRLDPFEPSIRLKTFEIDQLSFTRSITRQGKGARAAWRRQFRTLAEIPQSHAVIEWNATRAEFKEFNHQDDSYHGIRAKHRDLERLRNQLRGDPWAMIDKPSPIMLHGDEQAAPGSDDR